MAKKTDTEMCEIRHARVRRVRGACLRIANFAGNFVTGELTAAQLREAEYLVTKARDVSYHMSDEMLRVDLEQAERETGDLSRRFCALFQSAVDDMVKSTR